jgi:hypothetical protein
MTFVVGLIIGAVVGFLVGWIACAMIAGNPPDHRP